nr:MAG TPA: hypothetical protein [Caudoviricetes sp.]
MIYHRCNGDKKKESPGCNQGIQRTTKPKMKAISNQG